MVGELDSGVPDMRTHITTLTVEETTMGTTILKSITITMLLLKTNRHKHSNHLGRDAVLALPLEGQEGGAPVVRAAEVHAVQEAAAEAEAAVHLHVAVTAKAAVEGVENKLLN